MGTQDAKKARLAGTGAEVVLTIDGETVKAIEGRSLYDVISGMGKIIPAMCYHYTFTPFGSCGMCLVAVEGKKAPVRSCTSSVAPGMVVTTEEPPIKQAQKKALLRHLSTHPLDCPVCDADGHCELQDFTTEFGINEIPNVRQRGIPEDTRSTVLDLNMDRCIVCGECINICKEVQGIDALTFMKKGKFNIVTAKEDKPLDCEFCGDCLAVCPVGAITNKYSKYAYKPWQLKKTQTTCPYCGDGCQLIIETKDNQVTRVTSTLSWKKKWGVGVDTADGHGGTCGRGRFGFQNVNSPDRLTLPLIREDGELRKATWLDAEDLVAERLGKIRMDHGGSAIAGLISARCTNEDIFLFQKFMRLALGSNQIESTARYGHMNTVAALRKVLGTDRVRMMNTSAQVTQAKAILIIGSDITETHPLFNLRVKEAMRKYDAQVIVADPITTKMAKLAPHHLPIKPGSERWLIQGWVKLVLEKNLCDPAVLKKYPQAIEVLKKAVAGFSMDTVVSETGIDLERLSEVAAIFSKADRAVILFDEGITKRENGYDNILNLADLALVSGLFEKEGSGLNGLCEENNEVGLIDMGGSSEFLPGGKDVSDEAARAELSRAWHEELPPPDTTDLITILERARKGEIKALYIVGENPLGSLPPSLGVKEALEKIDFVVVQDPFLTETGALADVVLPATTYAEKEGTFTSMEGKVQAVQRAIEPVGESLPDWEIFSIIASRMGYPLEYGSAMEIHSEIARLIPGYFKKNPDPITARPEAYLNNGFSEDAPKRYAVKSSGGSSPFPFRLILGQLVHHSGKFSTRAEGLMKINDRGWLQVGTADAERLGLAAGGSVEMSSAHGSAVVPVEIRDSLPEGVVFFPEHFSGPDIRNLIQATFDPVTGVVYHKAGPVALKKGPGGA